MLTPERHRHLRRAGQRVAQVIEERDRAIREAVAEGAGLREVARAVGLSHAGVKKIVER